MLHISDVEKRLKLCPEPPQIKEMRHKVIDAFANLEFFEEPHEYILHKTNGQDIKLPSVSSIVHQFEPFTDWDKVRENKATKMGITDAELKRKWEENNIKSTSNGSKTHLFGESCLYFVQGRLDMIDHEISHYQMDRGYLVPYGPKEIAAAKLYEDVLYNCTIFPVMAESKIYTGYNDTFKLKNDYCGTFDILWAYQTPQGDFLPYILDFKTNKSLTNQYNRRMKNMMLPPFDDMVDEDLSHYTIQLSAYQMGLEQLGIKPRNRILIWLKDDGTYEKIPVPYVGDRLKATL